MASQERMLEQFNRLLAEGQKVLSQSGWDGKRYQRHPNDIDYQKFRTESLNIIRQACGEDSDHYRELKRICENEQTCYNSYYFKECYGVLQAAKNDFEGGWLFDMKALIAAELLGDFIDQSEMLFSRGIFTLLRL